MAADLKALDDSFRLKVEALLRNLVERGVEMRPFFTVRTPIEQAKLWRQSRSREDIEAASLRLRQAGANYLSHCLDSAGPCSGIEVTKALPGLSWHQWGLAVDCFWLVDGKSEWSSKKLVDGINGYAEYRVEAQLFGLHRGPESDWPHVQMPREGGPEGAGYTLAQVDERMRVRFG
jgi:hypothetical protein